jgi:zinc-ribbon domain
MAIFCTHCGTKLEDFMMFCYNCGNPPTGISTASETRKPKVEYKTVNLQWDKKPFIETNKYASYDLAITNSQGPVLELLKPYFDDGWQLDGPYSSAVTMEWSPKSAWASDVMQLKYATARLIRYS